MSQEFALAEDADPASEPIAIVGLAARVAGADDAEQFWHNLIDGVESVTFFTDPEQLARGATEADLADPGFVRAAPVVNQYDCMDAPLFGMTAREAEIADPQQRIFLEAAHSALVDAGYDSFRYPAEIAVYAGTGPEQYQWHNLRANKAFWPSANGLSTSVGNHSDYISTTASYRLNLRGPSITLHTACSSSLVAVHLACEALRNGECTMALAGGVNIELPHGKGYAGVEGYTSTDGHCRPFDAKASGTLWGSGAGVVVLKRLSDAVADRDTIRGVVLGNAVNNDGQSKVGFSAPSVSGQAAAIAQAVGMAGIDPRTVGYVEAHGTGTALGDPIEMAALSTVYGEKTDSRGWCGIGSVKGNIGHLSQAAGVIGLIKATLALQHGLMPPSINYEEPNPAIDFDSSPFYVVTALRRWERNGTPRRAGVSSFGIGGTNAHVVLQEAPAATPASRQHRPTHLLTLSAHTPSALSTLEHRLADRLTGPDAPDLSDVSYTLRAGWPAYPHRSFVVAADAASAAAALRDTKKRATGVAGDTPPGVALLFPGQGSQYAGMARQLYATEPVFAAALDDCLAPLGDDGVTLRGLLFPEPAEVAAANETLQQTRWTQPALFVVEYALAMLWRSWGVRPSAMIGHSVGEYVAATLAGVFDLADAVSLVAARGRLMGSMPAGSMLAVQLDEAEVAPLLPPEVSIATINGPGTCVVAGSIEAVEAFAATLAARKVAAKLLRTSHAFHTAMMQPIVEEFQATVAAVPRRAPSAPVVSTVYGDWLSGEQAQDPAYWAAQLREPVRFGAALGRLLSEGAWVLVECGPGRQLSGVARMQMRRGQGADGPAATPPVVCMPGPGDRVDEASTLYAAVGRLWLAGVPVDPEAFGVQGRRIPLVTFPYERTRHWVEPDLPGSTTVIASLTAPATTGRRPIEDWYAEPTWHQAPRRLAPIELDEPVLMFVADSRGERCVEQMRSLGARVVQVRPGTEFRGAGDAWQLRPSEADDYATLFDALAVDGEVPRRIVHAWALGDRPCGTDVAAAWAAQEHGFFSVLWLVQALAATEHTAVDIDIVHAGVERVVGDELVAPEHATLAGISRVLPLELPDLRIRRIDLGTSTPDGALLAELATEPETEVVALRGDRRWLPGFADVALPEPAAPVLRAGGSYLITGGTGGIGITLAEDIALRVPGVRLLLLSRTALPARDEWGAYLAAHPATERTARTIGAVQRMEAAGARVELLAGDVLDPQALHRLRETVAATGGLDGIVHAAGLPGGGVAEIKQRAEATAVLAPKLAGTLALAAELGPLTRDVIVLCSSITAVAGGFGQVDYCAANAFMDAFAASRHGLTARVVSLNWGAWSEVGMAAESTAPPILAGTRHRRFSHPLLSAREEGRHGLAYTGTLSPADHWVLDEHRLDGTPTLPGTAYLELALAVTKGEQEQSDEGTSVEISDVVFLDPLRVSTNAVVRVALDGDVFTVSSGGRTHARGTVTLVASPAPAPRLDLDAIRARSTPVPVHTPQGGLISYGPHWEVLREAWSAPGELLVRLERPAEPDGTPWTLHPSLLDFATAVVAFDVPGGIHLPFGYGRVLVRGALPTSVYSHIRIRSVSAGVLSADIALVDADGNEVVSITDFTMREIDRQAPPPAMVEAALPEPSTGAITPVEGVDALYRVLAAGLGPQVVVTTDPVEEIIGRVRQVSAEVTAGDATGVDVGGAAADGPDDLAGTIARVWQQVLGITGVGVDDDFFDLGGNSLVAVALITSLRTAVGVRLPMRMLFEAPTVGQMAERIDQLRKAEAAQSTVDATQSAIPRLTRG